MPRFLHLLPVLALGLAAGCGDGGGPARPPGSATVVEVIDGDTIEVRLDGRHESVRLLGIDTPETHDPRRPVECFGAEATAFTASLLPEGTEVLLVRDVEARDRYDRLLAYVYRASDGLFVNRALLEAGYAAVLTITPNVAHADDFVATAADARRRMAGLWGACGGPDTPA